MGCIPCKRRRPFMFLRRCIRLAVGRSPGRESLLDTVSMEWKEYCARMGFPARSGYSSDSGVVPEDPKKIQG
jgi:hypothetical protein